ncbi:PAS domain S-box protein [Chloroflexota bacterium]
MKDENKTKEQLIKELVEIRQQTAELKSSKAKDREMWLGALADNLAIGVYIVQDGKFQFANSILQELLGYSEEELAGMDSLSIVYPEDREVVRENAVKMLKGERSSPYEFRYVNKGGEILWVMETVTSVLYRGRRAALGNFMDITERKQAEANYRQLLEEMSDGYMVIQDGKYIFTNKRFSEMTGYDIGQLIGMPMLQFTMPEYHQTIVELRARMERGEEAYVELDEVIVMKADGTKMVAEASIKAIQYEGKPAFAAIIRDITERKRAEQALWEERGKARQYLNIAGVMIVAIDAEGKVTLINRKGCEVLGYKEEEIIGRNWFDNFLPERLVKQVKEVSLKLLAGEIEPAEYYENPVLTKSREERIIAWHNNILRDDADNIIGHLSSGEDITERKLMEEGLRRSEMKNQAIVNAIPDLMFQVSRDGIFLGYSGSSEDLYTDPNEFLDKNIRDVLPPEIAELSVQHIERALGSKATQVFDYQLQIGDGLRSFEARMIASGEDEVLSIMRDITDRKRAEDILRESEEKLRLIFESVPEGIVVTDLGGKILDINEGTIRMHGYDTKEELIGRNSLDLVAERDSARVRKDIKKVIEVGSTGVIRYSFVKKDGSEFPAATSSAVLRDARGQPRGVVAVTTDITEQQKMQEQLMLADRLASIGQLAAGIAHELNNPLAGVIGVSKLLLEKGVPDEVKEDLEIIDKEARRAANVVRGLLTFARTKVDEKALVDITSIIQDVLQLRSYEQRVSNIEVDKQFASGLPHVFVNGAQMQQVFVNIIVNAEQAMLDAHGRGRLRVTTEEAGDMVRISIDDDGPGISRENIKKLFNPFFTTKGVGKGTGLGLSICHGIVTEHSGRLYAKSGSGKGATFILELPILAAGDESNGKS